jgi:hypothetical protein
MASASEFPARGKVVSVQDNVVVFAPSNTNYELRLERQGGGPDAPAIPSGVVLDAVLRVTGRKIWTVPSGGNFIEPIYGPPRKIQGRIRYLDEGQMVVQAGTAILVKLPQDSEAFDLARGPLVVGGLVNVSALPNATIELLGAAAKRV